MPHRPVRMTAENVYGVKAVDLTFDSLRKLFVLTGRNGAGKTSVMKAFWLAILGPQRQGDAVLRRGATAGSVSVELDSGWIIKRVVELVDGKAKVRGVEITTSEGAKFGSPAAKLKAMIGDSLGIDPEKFATCKDEEARNILLNVAGMHDAIKIIDKEAGEIEESRKRVGYDRDNAKARLEAAGGLEGDPNDAPIDLSAARADYEAAMKQTGERGRLEGERNRLARDVKDLHEKIAQLRAKVAEMEERLGKANDALMFFEEPTAALDAARANLEHAEAWNARVARNAARLAAVDDYNTHCERYDQMTEDLKMTRQKKATLLEGAEFPHPLLGLSGEGEPLWDGRPIGWASYGERLEAGCALATSGRATIGLLSIEAGGELDNERLDRIVEFANERGFLVVIQRVAEDWDGQSIFIEDGTITHAAV